VLEAPPAPKPEVIPAEPRPELEPSRPAAPKPAAGELAVDRVLVDRAADLFEQSAGWARDQITRTSREFCKKARERRIPFGLNWFVAGLDAVAVYVQRNGSPPAAGWGYLVGAFKIFLDGGGPPPPAVPVKSRGQKDAEKKAEQRRVAEREAWDRAAEEAAVTYLLEHLDANEVDRLVEKALGLLPEGIVRRNNTLTNPFVRAKVYELACEAPDPAEPMLDGPS